MDSPGPQENTLLRPFPKVPYVRAEISLRGFWSKSCLENCGFFWWIFRWIFACLFSQTKLPEKIHQKIHRRNQTPKSTKNFREGVPLTYGIGTKSLQPTSYSGESSMDCSYSSGCSHNNRRPLQLQQQVEIPQKSFIVVTDYRYSS